MPNYLLTGAGFTRNWEGWLASEAFEYLLGCPELGHEIRSVLWKSQRRGAGFEDALSVFQQRSGPEATEQLRLLNNAISRMFVDMNSAVGNNVEFAQPQEFLILFDAIFTLNQDLLLEKKYLNDNLQLRSNGRWNGWVVPGTRPVGQAREYRTPDLTLTEVRPKYQPYFKLHGSSDLIEDDRVDAAPLLVMGANKSATINRYPLLRWYADEFARHLAQPDARLMVIGYGFRDDHINNAIMKASVEHGLKVFIIDPEGVAVFDPVDPRAAIRPPKTPLAEALEAATIGASRRSIRSIVGGDDLEYQKVMRFFQR